MGFSLDTPSFPVTVRASCVRKSPVRATVLFISSDLWRAAQRSPCHVHGENERQAGSPNASGR
ncbi:hypothetical protein WS75_25470 [Burkholderia sp. FL-7-2-10-S1-D7]|nr:hypothetical protein WS75_25470 [Burkholderia sp. FL-7-2-10-S1-D7]